MNYTIMSSVGVLLRSNTLCCDSAQVGGALGRWSEGAGGETHIRQHNMRLPIDTQILRTCSTQLAYNIYARAPQLASISVSRTKTRRACMCDFVAVGDIRRIVSFQDFSTTKN